MCQSEPSISPDQLKAWIQMYSSMRNAPMKQENSINSANLGSEHHCPNCVHYATDNSAELYQKNLWPEKRLTSCMPRMEESPDGLSQPLAPLCRIHTLSRSNGHGTVPHCDLSHAPFARIVLANCWEAMSEVAEMSPSALLPYDTHTNAQRNATH